MRASRLRALRVPPDPAAGRDRPVARRRRRLGHLHDRRQLESALAGRDLRGRALRLEQGPGVPEVPRAPVAHRTRASSSRSRATRSRTASCSRAAAGASGTRSTSRPTSTRIATTSGARAPSSRSPRTRTSGCGRAGSATAARRTSPPAGPWWRKTPASATCSRPATRSSRSPRSTPRSPRSRRSRATTLAPGARRSSSPASTSTPASCSGGCWRRSASSSRGRRRGAPLPATLDLEPVSRRPTTLAAETVEAVLRGRCRRPAATASGPPPRRSIVVVAADGLVFTRLCLESVLANAARRDVELVVVDNGSSDGTRDYLAALAERDSRVRSLRNDENRGFGAAVNQGLSVANGDVLVVLNNDTIVPPGWLARLVAHLARPRSASSARRPTGAGTRRRSKPATAHTVRSSSLRGGRSEHDGVAFDIDVATLFCAAIRRDVYERVGALDERFEVGLFEDDDYSRPRARGRAPRRLRRGRLRPPLRRGRRSARSSRPAATRSSSRRTSAASRRSGASPGSRTCAGRTRGTASSSSGSARSSTASCRRTRRCSSSRTATTSSWSSARAAAAGTSRRWRTDYAGHHPGDSAEAIAHLEALREKGRRVHPRSRRRPPGGSTTTSTLRGGSHLRVSRSAANRRVPYST